MPKTRIRSHKQGGKSVPASLKYKLGGRKSAVSALLLSNTELLRMYSSPKIPKDKDKISKVLARRGVQLAESHINID